jgi:hypothetical protein
MLSQDEINRLYEDMEEKREEANLYQRKKDRMGLTSDELDKYYKLLGDVMCLRAKFQDGIFDKFILQQIMGDEIIKLFQELNEILDWNGEILVQDEQITNIIKNFDNESEKSRCKELLKEIRDRLHNNLMEILEFETQEQVFEHISLVITDEQSEDYKNVLPSYLNFKFDYIIDLLDDYDRIFN